MLYTFCAITQQLAFMLDFYDRVLRYTDSFLKDTPMKIIRHFVHRRIPLL